MPQPDPVPQPALVLRSDDPRARQVEADGWECIATSWGARLTLGPADAALLTHLRGLVDRVSGADFALRELGHEATPHVLALDALTAGDYPGGAATHHEPLSEQAARELLDQGRAWGIWSGEGLVALTVTRTIEDRVETQFTTVHPDHRRRGLATAVKAASVLAHVRAGQTVFGTGGAESNLASLAMNVAVGYRITETWHTYRRRARAGSSALPTSSVTAGPAVLLDTMVHPDLQGH